MCTKSIGLIMIQKVKKVSEMNQSTNIVSIRSKYDELQIFTQELLGYDFKFDVICIQESWLGGNDDLLFYSLMVTCVFPIRKRAVQKVD